MDFFILILFFIILFISLLIWGALILFVKLIEYHRLKRRFIPLRQHRLIVRWIVFILLVIYSLFQTYIAYYPSDGFYESKFEYYTGLDFPKTAKIIKKDSWYPDFHGDYWAAAIFETSKNDYEMIKNQLLTNSDFRVDTSKQGIGITTDFWEMTTDIEDHEIVLTFAHNSEEWFKVAFLVDNKTIIFERSSS